MIIIMILMMILHVNDNKVMLIEMLSFLNDLFIYFLCFRGVCLKCLYYLSLMFEM